jgi:putative ABC transport system permease protein
VKPANVLRLYRVRLRSRLLQECFAVLGIAAGVALLFASQVSSSSLQGSVTALTEGVDGSARLQLLARGPQGFPAALLARVRAVPGVERAAPLLEAGAAATGPGGRRSLQLIGADESLASLGGRLVRGSSLAPFGGVAAVVLPASLANELGVRRFGQEMTLQLAGRSLQVPLYEVLGARRIGPLAASPIAIAPLSFVQEAAILPGRLSRILVQPSAGAQARVLRALTALAGPGVAVEPTSYDATLFANAAQASNQSTALFSAISALVGFLFAFNAMLLTVPARRRLIADLRRDGYTPATVIGVLLLDALALGVAGCALGLAAGEELSRHFLRAEPQFLSLAFPVGSQRTVTAQTVAIAVGGGMGAAVVAVLSPLRDILSRDPLAAVTPHGGSGGGARGGGSLALAGIACLAAATALLLRAPDASIPAMALLVLALLLMLPLALSATLALTGRAAGLIVSPIPHVATMELRAARARAVAIAATGAVAVFGSVAIQGAHGDLLAGLERAARERSALADLWVAPTGSYNLLDDAPLPATNRTAPARLARLPGIAAVRVYRSALLDYGPRRVLAIAPPQPSAHDSTSGGETATTAAGGDGTTHANTATLPSPDQILVGDPSLAAQRVRDGGWVDISRAMAEEHGLGVGDAVTLPTPAPARVRVAAIVDNLGWAPGAIVMSPATFVRAWGNPAASAYAIQLRPGFSARRAAAELRRALGGGGGLAVSTATAHAAAQSALDRQALSRLTQIATLIPIVAVLAMAAAMAAMLWQRRPRLAKLKLEGLARVQLWRTVLLEALLLLSAGCVCGALFGLYGQHLADRALAQAINFPVVYSLSSLAAVRAFALVAGAAVAILAVPGYLAASVPAALALQD